MIIILSPTKIFREYSSENLLEYMPLKYNEQTMMLVERLSELEIDELEKMMKISRELAECNYKRFKQFTEPSPRGYRAADYFYGEAFKSLDAPTMSQEARTYMGRNLRILSGLYGSIEALEVIKPYRLEMGTKLSGTKGDTLYSIWKEILTEEMLDSLKKTEGDQVLINLASDEYSKALDLKQIAKSYPVITLHFKVKKGEDYKVVGMYAKKARGLMARFICENQIEKVEELKQFKEEGYQFTEHLSTDCNWVFVQE